MMANHGGVHNISNISTHSSISNLFTESYIVLLSVLAALIFIINLMVIFLFATRDNLRTKTNMILVSLALSDALNGVLVIPLQIMVNIHMREQSLRLASMVFYRFIAVSTMLHILAVTLERHICILSPLRYHSLVTKARIIKTLVSIWLLAICNSVISLSWIGLADEYNHLKQPPGLHNSKLLRCEFTYTLFTFVFFFIIPLVIMAYSFKKIICEISRHNRRDSELMLDTRNSIDSGEEIQPRQTYISDRKPILIFLAMLLVFSITWSSWYAQIIILSTSPKHYLPVGGVWPGFARSSTSVINPLIYSLIKKDFRQALKSWLNRLGNLATFWKTTTTEQEFTSKFTT
jgi:hypothetical protein